MVVNFLYHQSNLETKIRTDYGGRGELFSQFKSVYYDPYREAQLAITTVDAGAILQKISLLTAYYRQVELFNEEGWIKPQSKFRPTILEEFLWVLFKDLPLVQSLDLGFFNKRIFAGMAISSDGKAVIKTKISISVSENISMSFLGVKLRT